MSNLQPHKYKRLEKIYIRAQVNGEWGSHSLKTLIDMGQGNEIYKWFIDRLSGLIGFKDITVSDYLNLPEYPQVEYPHVENIIILLESLGVRIVEIK